MGEIVGGLVFGVQDAGCELRLREFGAAHVERGFEPRVEAVAHDGQQAILVGGLLADDSFALPVPIELRVGGHGVLGDGLAGVGQGRGRSVEPMARTPGCSGSVPGYRPATELES